MFTDVLWKKIYTWNPYKLAPPPTPFPMIKHRQKSFLYIFNGKWGGVAAVISRGPMTKFLLWFIFVHDFESYPSDRELSYDFSWTLVMLIYTYCVLSADCTGKKKEQQLGARWGKTRPDTRLSKSRAGGQGLYLRSLDHLDRSSEIQK